MFYNLNHLYVKSFWSVVKILKRQSLNYHDQGLCIRADILKVILINVSSVTHWKI